MKVEHYCKLEKELMNHWNGLSPQEIANVCNVSYRQAMRMIDEVPEHLPVCIDYDKSGRKRIKLNIKERMMQLRELYGFSLV